ncbi:pyrimidodiazepine synthase-like [Acanthaster planci]|uniref:Glutathione S-transferase omega n=1 Tax=Acanthaster planci TaxID=133434 RepID=A0A8B7YFN1_ACAPL|nr:pyrimidodiazepine synthase-like [Acanthaster planci]
MRFSPFAHSVRLVLMTKGISYDEIYCDLRRKPEFLLERNHIGKIPVLEVNGKIIIESVVICELLEELYPDPPLYPKDPFEKAQQRIVLEIYRAKVCQPMEYALRSFTKDNKDVDTVMDGLKIIERRLMKRETPFFGGPKPGMVDLIMWPFNEGLIILDPEYEMVRARMPNLFNYFQHMMTIPAIQATTLPRELHVQFLLGLLTKKFQYDFPEITL